MNDRQVLFGSDDQRVRQRYLGLRAGFGRASARRTRPAQLRSHGIPEQKRWPSLVELVDDDDDDDDDDEGRSVTTIPSNGPPLSTVQYASHLLILFNTYQANDNRRDVTSQ